MSARFAIEALTKAHQRKTFSCGNERIDRYFRETVTQECEDIAARRVDPAAACWFQDDRRPRVSWLTVKCGIWLIPRELVVEVGDTRIGRRQSRTCRSLRSRARDTHGTGPLPRESQTITPGGCDAAGRSSDSWASRPNTCVRSCSSYWPSLPGPDAVQCFS